MGQAVAAAPVAAQALAGPMLDGQRDELASRRGHVVMVVLWRSDCAVCMGKRPERRVNTPGWKQALVDRVLVPLETELMP